MREWNDLYEQRMDIISVRNKSYYCTGYQVRWRCGLPVGDSMNLGMALTTDDQVCACAGVPFASTPLGASGMLSSCECDPTDAASENIECDEGLNRLIGFEGEYT